MFKRILILSCIAVCLFCSQAVFADTTATPTPPPWVLADEYLVFDKSAAYREDIWKLLTELRELAEAGEQGDSLEFTTRWNMLEKSNDPGILYELALINYKTLSNGGKHSYPILLDTASKRLTLEDPNYMPLKIWHMRAKVWAKFAYNSLYGVKALMAEVLNHPDFDLETILSHKDFDYVRTKPEFSLLYEPFFFIDNEYFAFEDPVVIRDGRTLVPIRRIVEMIGGTIAWNNESKTATITRGSKKILLTIDRDIAIVNGVPKKLDTPPLLLNKRTMLPLRFVAENLDQVVDYYPEKNIVSIYEDTAFEEGKNWRSWMLGTCAIIARSNAGNPFAVGMFDRTKSGPEHAREILLKSWNCDSREDIQEQINSLLKVGHNGAFLADAAYIKSLSTTDLNALIEREDDATKHIYQYILDLSNKWGTKGIKAWDLFRVCHLAAWGYTGGYFDLKEAYALAEPAMKELRNSFSSWEEATENYLDGFAYWSRNDIKKDGTVYQFRLSVYQTLKLMDKIYGGLYDKAVWTEPVSSVTK